MDARRSWVESNSRLRRLLLILGSAAIVFVLVLPMDRGLFQQVVDRVGINLLIPSQNVQEPNDGAYEESMLRYDLQPGVLLNERIRRVLPKLSHPSIVICLNCSTCSEPVTRRQLGLDQVNGLTVIGVVSAPTERLAAQELLGISSELIVDKSFTIISTLNAFFLPRAYLINPSGHLLASQLPKESFPTFLGRTGHRVSRER